MKFKKQKLLTVLVFLFLLTTLALAACGAKAHDFSDGEWEMTKEATCTESGSKRRVCTVEGCGHTEVVTVPALGHDLIPEQITDRPLCETGGTMTMKCSRCDFKDEITPSARLRRRRKVHGLRKGTDSFKGARLQNGGGA